MITAKSLICNRRKTQHHPITKPKKFNESPYLFKFHIHKLVISQLFPQRCHKSHEQLLDLSESADVLIDFIFNLWKNWFLGWVHVNFLQILSALAELSPLRPWNTTKSFWVINESQSWKTVHRCTLSISAQVESGWVSSWPWSVHWWCTFLQIISCSETVPLIVWDTSFNGGVLDESSAWWAVA